MPNLKIIWEGKISLNNIKWNKKIINKYKFSHEYKKEAEKAWHNHIKKHPNDYNGTLLFLDKFFIKKRKVFLKISLIKFSIANYILKKRIPLKEGLGVLGTQYLVFSPNLKHILIGRRSLSQSYFPGAINVPGGILEFTDLSTPPSIAFIRELKEEVPIPLKSSSFYLRAILGGWDNVSVTFLISTIIDDDLEFNPNKTVPSDNNEWEGNLKWLSSEKLQKMAPNNFLDGLIYYQLKLIKKNQSSNF